MGHSSTMALPREAREGQARAKAQLLDGTFYLLSSSHYVESDANEGLASQPHINGEMPSRAAAEIGGYRSWSGYDEREMVVVAIFGQRVQKPNPHIIPIDIALSDSEVEIAGRTAYVAET